MFEEFAHRFKNARRASGMTQGEIADLLNLNPAAVAMIESGRQSFTIEFIELFCKKTGVSRAYMYLGEGSPVEDARRQPSYNQEDNRQQMNF